MQGLRFNMFDVRLYVRLSVHILMADAFFGLHSKEVGRGDGRGRGHRRRRFGRRRRNFLFAFFSPIGCRRRRPPNPALAGFWPGWPSSFASSTLSESNTPMPTVRRRRRRRRRRLRLGPLTSSGGNVVGNGNGKESEWRESRARVGRREEREGQCKNRPRSKVVKL